MATRSDSQDWRHFRGRLQKIKSIKNPIKHTLKIKIKNKKKSETNDSFDNLFYGHFAYLKTLDFYFKRYGWKKIAPIVLKALPLRQQSLQRLCRSDSNRSKGFAAPTAIVPKALLLNGSHSNGIAPTTITPTELHQRQSLQRICSSGNHFNTNHSSGGCSNGGCSKGIRFKRSFCFSGICQLSVPLRSLIFSSSSLMTIGHKTVHYCHFRVPSVDSDTGWKKKKERKVLEFIGTGMTPSTWRSQGWGQNCAHLGGVRSSLWLCGGNGVASVVCAAAEALVLEAVVASSSICRLQFEVRAPHTRLTNGDLVQHGEAFGEASVL